MSNYKYKFQLKYLIAIAVLALGLYVILPQLGSFKASWQLVRSANLDWLMVAGVLTILTYVAAAFTYHFLAFNKLSLVQLSLVQAAAMFINRLLPAGLGALGTNYWYLYKHKHTKAQAVAIVSINNLLGFVGHAILLALLLIFGAPIHKLHVAHMSTHNLLFVLTVVGILAILILIIAGKKRIVRNISELVQQLSFYRHHPSKLALALMSSVCLTLINISVLYASGQAVGLNISLSALAIVFTLGIGLATAVPTPGGLGGFEAGLVAGFVAFNFDNSLALATALVYRLVTYWFALLLGALAFFIAGRLSYI